MSNSTTPRLTETAVAETLSAAGWVPATDRGRRCAIDEWADAGDFSTEAEHPHPDGTCSSVLLSCRTADCVPTLTEMAAALRRGGFATADTGEGMEFLRVLPPGSRSRGR